MLKMSTSQEAQLVDSNVAAEEDTQVAPAEETQTVAPTEETQVAPAEYTQTVAPAEEDTQVAPAEETQEVVPPSPYAEFNRCFQVRVSRFELYPSDESPSAWVVGFTATCIANNKTKYMDVQVPIQNGVKEEAVLKTAWDSLSANFMTWGKDIKHKAAIINQIFVPV
jgi:hypothetical protein